MQIRYPWVEHYWTNALNGAPNMDHIGYGMALVDRTRIKTKLYHRDIGNCGVQIGFQAVVIQNFRGGFVHSDKA